MGPQASMHNRCDVEAFRTVARQVMEFVQELPMDKEHPEENLIIIVELLIADF